MVRVKDWQILFKTEGEQLSFVLVCGIWSLILYFLVSILPEIGCYAILIAITKGITLFLAAFYFVYCMLLTKKIIDKYYK